MVTVAKLSRSEIEQLSLEAVRVIPGTARPEIVLLCEHGGQAIPTPWEGLGLPSSLIGTHFGSDLGATALTRLIAEKIGATAVIANYSRLFLDYNRKRTDSGCWRIDMGGIPIPGNLNLTEDEIEIREQIARAPVERAVADATENGRAKAIVSIHSFSPYWNNEKRECEIGVMWREDARLAPTLIDAIAVQKWLKVDDNEPYDFRTSDWFTLDRHGLSIGLPCAYIEVRNDLIDAHDKLDKVACALGTAIRMACDDLTETS